MKNEILLDAIGKIDEELVFAAEKSKRKKFKIYKELSMSEDKTKNNCAPL